MSRPARLLTVTGGRDAALAIRTSMGGYWPLAESSSGAGAVTRNDRKYTSHLTDNGATPSTTGLRTLASDHNNLNFEFFSVASNANLRHSGNAFTWAIWFYPTSVAIVRGLLGKGMVATFNLEYLLEMQMSRVIRFRISSDGLNIGTSLSTTATATLDAWNYILVKHDPTNDLLIAKLNNTTAVTTAHSAGIFDDTGALNIGREPNTSGLWLGRLNEAMFVKRLTTDAEDTYLWNGGAGRTL